MSNTLPPLDYTTTSNDVGIIAQEIESVLSDTITINASAWNMSYTGNSFTVGSNITSIPSMTISSNGNVGIGTISGIGASTFQWKNHEFVDAFPDYDKVQEMCKQYPGLRIAYEKFVTTYKLVKDDYDSTKD